MTPAAYTAAEEPQMEVFKSQYKELIDSHRWVPKPMLKYLLTSLSSLDIALDSEFDYNNQQKLWLENSKYCHPLLPVLTENPESWIRWMQYFVTLSGNTNSTYILFSKINHEERITTYLNEAKSFWNTVINQSCINMPKIAILDSPNEKIHELVNFYNESKINDILTVLKRCTSEQTRDGSLSEVAKEVITAATELEGLGANIYNIVQALVLSQKPVKCDTIEKAWRTPAVDKCSLIDVFLPKSNIKIDSEDSEYVKIDMADVAR